jgi:hypothetical protein
LQTNNSTAYMTAFCNGFCLLILEHEAVCNDLVRDKEIVAVAEESKDCAFRNLLKKTCISSIVYAVASRLKMSNIFNKLVDASSDCLLERNLTRSSVSAEALYLTPVILAGVIGNFTARVRSDHTRPNTALLRES